MNYYDYNININIVIKTLKRGWAHMLCGGCFMFTRFNKAKKQIGIWLKRIISSMTLTNKCVKIV